MQTSGKDKPTGLPILAAASGAAITFLFPAVALVVLLVLGGPRALEHAFQEMGGVAYSVLLAMALAWMATPLLMLVLAWRPRVPGAVFLGLGVLPWLVGMAGTLFSEGQVVKVLTLVNPISRLSVGAAGTSEALTSSLFGGGVSAVLLLGMALALALAAAVGARHPERPRVPGAFPLACAALAVGIAALMAPLMCQRELLSLAGSVSSMDYELGLGSALDELSTVRRVSGPVTWVALLGVLTAAGWALSHFREVLPMGRAAAVGLVALLPLVMHTQMQQRLIEDSRLLSVAPWDKAQDFVPMTVKGVEVSRMRPDAVVTRTHLVPREGAPVPLDGAVAAALRALLPEAETTPEEEEEARGPGSLRLTPTLVLAVDARLTGPRLGQVLEAARAAGVRSVYFLGAVSSEGLRQRVSTEPLLEGYVRGATSTTGRVALLSAVRGGVSAADLTWHARLEAPGPFTVMPGEGDSESPRTVDPSMPRVPTEMDSESSDLPPVYLTLGEKVAAADVVRACEHVAPAFPRHPLVLLSGSSGQPLRVGDGQ